MIVETGILIRIRSIEFLLAFSHVGYQYSGDNCQSEKAPFRLVSHVRTANPPMRYIHKSAIQYLLFSMILFPPIPFEEKPSGTF